MEQRPTVDLLVHSASQLLTLTGGPQRGNTLGALGIIANGAVAIRGGLIVATGSTEDLRRSYSATSELSAAGRVVLPGFVDPHTHLVWAGDRAAEFEQRIQGASYLEILEAGGGILSTVRRTRFASLETLLSESRPRLRQMLAHGTTTAEAKTGYGLELEAELRLLQAILALDSWGGIDLVPTFLPAHAVPEGWQPDEYVALICEQMLPALIPWWASHGQGRPLPFVDVFCEVGAFDLKQSRQVLECARALGYALKIHADEFNPLGAAGLAAELGAISADHLLQTPDSDLKLLSESETVAVALPATPFGLAASAYPPAQAILKHGGILALGTDLNPGTAWCENMQFVIGLACRTMGLSPAQAIAAATINAAAAVGRDKRVGSLEPGKEADLLLLRVSDYRQLGYRFGTNLVSTVIKKGQIVVAERTDGLD
ncbi:MAG: imidazolonepropionase [Anaerolineales bacterium]